MKFAQPGRLRALLVAASFGAAVLTAGAAAPSNAAAVASLSVTNAAPVAGEMSALSGQLPTRFARAVNVQYKSGTAWKNLAQLHAAATGRFSWSTKVTAARTIRVLAPAVKHAKKQYPAVASAARAVTPVAQSATLTNASPAGQTPVALSATFRPARPGRQVVLQALTGGHWAQVGAAAQTSTGKAVFSYAPASGASPTTTSVRALTAARSGAPAYATSPIEVENPVDAATLVSVDDDDSLATSAAQPSISDDGNRVVYLGNFPAEPGINNGPRVFLRDVAAETTLQVSNAPNAIPGDWPSSDPVISGNGRYVVYATEDPNITPQPKSSSPQLVRYDTLTHTTELVSVSPLAGNTIWSGETPSISTDGSRIAFTASTQISDGLTGNKLYVRDMDTDQAWEIPAPANVWSAGSMWDPAISGDGRYVAFRGAHPRAPGSDYARWDIYRYDTLTNTTATVSVAPDGTTTGGDDSDEPHISDDGHLVSFASWSGNLVAGVGRGYHVYVRDLSTGTTRVRPGDEGVAGTTPVDSNAISGDGYTLAALWLIPDSCYQAHCDRQVRVYDLEAGTSRTVCTDTEEGSVNGLALTPDGRFGVYADGNVIHRFTTGRYDVNATP